MENVLFKFNKIQIKWLLDKIFKIVKNEDIKFDDLYEDFNKMSEIDKIIIICYESFKALEFFNNEVKILKMISGDKNERCKIW